MAKKTWISIKRGFLQPEHRMAMGIRVWLYMFIIDQADWETGQVLDWKDQAAADELGMPLSTLRQQRQELETLRYIDCVQEGNHQRIIINKWIDPRSYSGKVLNDNDKGNNKGEVESNNKGHNKGHNKGTETSSPLHSTQIPNIKDQKDAQFQNIQHIIERISGLPCGGFRDSEAIDQLVKMGATEPDIQEAYDWYTSQGNTFKYYSSLVKTTQTAMAKRLQTEHVKPLKKVKHHSLVDGGGYWEMSDGSKIYDAEA